MGGMSAERDCVVRAERNVEKEDKVQAVGPSEELDCQLTAAGRALSVGNAELVPGCGARHQGLGGGVRAGLLRQGLALGTVCVDAGAPRGVKVRIWVNFGRSGRAHSSSSSS